MSSAFSLSDMLDKKCIDVAFITEHKLMHRSQHFLSSINSDFYFYNTCDANVDNYGLMRCGKAGTAILIRKSLNTIVSQVNNIDNDRIVGIEIRKNNHTPLYVFCIYMPSNSDVKCYNDVLCDVHALYAYYCKLGTVVLAGDFNAQLDTEPRCIPNQKSKLLSAFVQRNGLLPVQSLFNSNAFTYIPAKSRIDHVLTERASSHLFAKYSVADPQDIMTSDHLPIFFPN